MQRSRKHNIIPCNKKNNKFLKTKKKEATHHYHDFIWRNLWSLCGCFWNQPWDIVRSFTVLQILSSQQGVQDFRLTLDLNRVLTKVDLPKPLWPAHTHRQRVSMLAVEHASMSLDSKEKGQKIYMQVHLGSEHYALKLAGVLDATSSMQYFSSPFQKDRKLKDTLHKTYF